MLPILSVASVSFDKHIMHVATSLAIAPKDSRVLSLTPSQCRPVSITAARPCACHIIEPCSAQPLGAAVFTSRNALDSRWTHSSAGQNSSCLAEWPPLCAPTIVYSADGHGFYINFIFT